MSGFMFFAVLFVWGNLALQIYALAINGVSPLRIFLLILGVVCVICTSTSAIQCAKGSA